MLISQFARAAGLSTDTIRFYVRKGLLVPETGGKGCSNPYQIFTADHVEAARMIRTAKFLGFSLKEIASFAEDDRLGRLTAGGSANIMRMQLAKLETKADHLAAMIGYMRAKLSWLRTDGDGPKPRFDDFAPESKLR